ncbi:sigma-70 family RNA polymerase sigma factor [Streptomyces sp. NPDC052013]|uniref:sigma-70 family RNA polymerase sigma factor n=1 Tax=Streptomyces sp. NPDC052013 TaxID=3365679 RepID=UPI0037D738D7
MAASGEWSAAATVVAARRGDQRAQDELVAGCLPLVYNIVGRALNGHPDVDDVVQETMLRALRSLGSLDDPARFRSWLVAITMNQIRHHWRDHRAAPASSGLHDAYDVADPGADFVDLTITRLGLEGQRRELAEATRWLDPDDQALLSLWWLEAVGELTRAEVAAALELSPQHTAVRVQRMKAQLETARLVVRSLSAQPRCVLLDDVTSIWDGTPSALWRKRIARHARACTHCSGFQSGLAPAEGLLVGLGLVPVAGLLGGTLAGFAGGATDAAPVAFSQDTGATELIPGLTETAEPAMPDAGAAYGDAGPDAPGAGVVHGDAGPDASNADASYADRVSGAPTAEIAAVHGPRSSRRALTRRRRRRSRAVAAVAAALLVTGGTISGIVILTPDGEGKSVQSASEGREASAPSDTVTRTPSAAASSSTTPSRTPSASASPSARKPPRKTPTTRPAQPERTEPKQPQQKPPSAPQAAPAGTPAAQVLALTNAERGKAGCGPVTADNRLARAAQLHSEDMSANDYFDHTGQDGRSFADRAKAQGYQNPGAENIARGQSSAASVMDAWMNSPGHRANILNCDLRTMGVGVTTNDWTWTQVFGF